MNDNNESPELDKEYETWLDELNRLLRCPTCNGLDERPNPDCPDCVKSDWKEIWEQVK